MGAPTPDHTAVIAAPGTGLRYGRVTGYLRHDPVRFGPRRGRVRRWLYAAVGGTTEDGTTVVAGAAVARLGPVVVAFAYATVGERTLTFEARGTVSSARTVGSTPQEGASFHRQDARLELAGDGALDLWAATPQGLLEVRGRTAIDVLPVVLVTATSGGGWNVTEKAAGTAASLELAIGGEQVLVPDASGWRDWTAGRQDRRTTWRWAAGAGRATDGARVGLNASTGMNGVAEGEDLLWVDGHPRPLRLDTLAPADEDALAGPWYVRGSGTQLDLSPLGQRSRREHLGPVVSEYTQPIGRWHGTVPAGGDDTLEVELVGVAEDHRAVW